MKPLVKIKICGITNAQDAQTAVDAGADALGFVFYQHSPRFIRPETAKAIIADLPPFVLPVGVFVNEDLDDLRSLYDECGLALAQLHGDESPEYCEALRRPLLRGIRMRDQENLRSMQNFQGRAGVKGFLIDAFSEKTFGGTGTTTDWSLALQAAKLAPILLAGGLTPENVQEAIRFVQPYGVDVSSGVEAMPGKKDPKKVQAFIQAVQYVSSG